MSIFYKFGCEAGDASNVPCNGINMSLSDLKRAVVDQRRMNNVTEFDLQVENGQTGKVYTIEEEIIPRGTTVQIRRVPLPRGEKKIWR